MGNDLKRLIGGFIIQLGTMQSVKINFVHFHDYWIIVCQESVTYTSFLFLPLAFYGDFHSFSFISIDLGCLQSTSMIPMVLWNYGCGILKSVYDRPGPVQCPHFCEPYICETVVLVFMWSSQWDSFIQATLIIVGYGSFLGLS